MRFFKALFAIALFAVAFILFLPKANLYYFAEKQFAGYDLYLSGEEIKEGLASLRIKNADIIFEDLHVGTFGSFEFKPFSLSYFVRIQDLSLEARSLSYLPKSLKNLNLSYNLKDIKKITITSENDLGAIRGYFDLFEQKLFIEAKVDIKKEALYKKLLQNFKKKAKGEYAYEKTFKLY